MSLTRRLAAGLPAAGVTLFAAFALGGTPASAADSAVLAANPAATSSPCTGGGRECATGYGADSDTPSADTGTAPATGIVTGGGTVNGTVTGHTRGGHGYGGTSPTTAPTTAPTGYTDTVPPGGVSPTEVPSPSQGSGVSPVSELPVTGAPGATTLGAGALLVAAGGFALWYTRRRSAA